MNVIKIVETYFIFHLQRLIPNLGNPYATITKKKKKKKIQIFGKWLQLFCLFFLLHNNFILAILE